MRIAIIGTGYVGLVSGTCFAETGNHVVCADVDPGKVERLSRGEIPIYEPGLDILVKRGLEEGRLSFTTDVGAAIERSRVVFIAVGTPASTDGRADLRYVLSAAEVIGRHMNGPKVVVTKSTVPVGTTDRVRDTIAAHTQTQFWVCSNPEFLKEGAAVDDFLKPDRVIVGADSDEARRVMQELYAPFVRTGNPILFLSIRSAEVTKYAANAMLATRISFMNQMAELCERVGADVKEVRTGIGTDRRIGNAFLFPGPGYGGSCFPKDVRAIVHTATELGVRFDLLESVEAVNARQLGVLEHKVVGALGQDLAGKIVAVWGLAFKAGTDDMRDSPSVPLVEGMLRRGATVRVHDPKAHESARAVFGDRVDYAADPYEAAAGADVLVIVTEWLVYRNPDFERLRASMRRPLMVDGRNLYEPEAMEREGFEYRCIGRRQV